jgi:hypothetical protein
MSEYNLFVVAIREDVEAWLERSVNGHFFWSFRGFRTNIVRFELNLKLRVDGEKFRLD